LNPNFIPTKLCHKKEGNYFALQAVILYDYRTIRSFYEFGDPTDELLGGYSPGGFGVSGTNCASI
jgi:hypothetical protein